METNNLNQKLDKLQNEQHSNKTNFHVFAPSITYKKLEINTESDSETRT
jgi:hypothetical protein